MSQKELLDTTLKGISKYATYHKLMDEYYEGQRKMRKMGITMPQTFRYNLETVVGWPATAVDVLEERLDFLGWDDDGKFGLEDVFLENQFASESSLANIDCLLYGMSFFALSTGREREGYGDEKGTLITAETARHTTGRWNRKTRRMDVAASRYKDPDGQITSAVLYELNQNTYWKRKDENSLWKMDGKPDRHNLGRLSLVRIINRGRAGRLTGKSEITRAVRSYTDTAIRTLADMELNREFFSAPQRYVLGAKEDAFVDANGQPIPGWKAIMGALWQLQRDQQQIEDTEGKSDGLPQVGQFPANPPGPFLEQIRGLAQMLSAEASIPATYLGFSTDNAPSADAIRALEARLIKRAERRQTAWDPAYLEVAQLAAMIEGNKIPKKSQIQTIWRDPATPTKSADADRAVKLVGAEILPPQSPVTWDLVGLSPKEQKRLKKYLTSAEFMKVIREGMTAPQPGGENVPPANGTQPGNPATSKKFVEQPAGQ